MTGHAPSDRSMDETDLKILDMLAGDSRESYAKMASRLNLTPPSVRRRVERLVSRGRIKRFTIERGDEGTSAIVLLNTDSGSDTGAIAETLSHLPGVCVIYEITGHHDIAAVIQAPSIPEINRSIDILRSTPGIQDTNTAIILRRVL